MPEPVVKDEEQDDLQEKVDVTPSVKVSDEEALAAKIKSDFEALYVPRLKDLETKLSNQQQGARRIEQDKERLQRENEQLRQQAKPPSPSTDPWAKIEDGQTWKAEVERVAEQKADEKLKAHLAQQAYQQSVQQQQQAREGSKQRVISKYPDLHPESGTEDSIVSKTYLGVLSEHPDWLANPYGPELAMYAMEEKLRASAAGNGSPNQGKGGSRVATTSLPPSRQSGPSDNRITLTKELKFLCDRYGWKYEDYAKTAAALEQGAIEA